MTRFRTTQLPVALALIVLIAGSMTIDVHGQRSSQPVPTPSQDKPRQSTPPRGPIDLEPNLPKGPVDPSRRPEVDDKGQDGRSIGQLKFPRDSGVFEPGQPVAFPQPVSKTAGTWSIHIREVALPNRTWVLPSHTILPIPRVDTVRAGTVGFIVPQLPGGQYEVFWKSSDRTGPKMPITIRPRLIVIGNKVVPYGEEFTLTVRIPGPRSRPRRADAPATPAQIAPEIPAHFLSVTSSNLFRPDILLSDLPADAKIVLGSGQAPMVRADDDGRAVFRLRPVRDGSTDLTFTTHGIEPVTFTVTSNVDELVIPPNGPDQAPLIYVHGYKDDGTAWARGSTFLLEDMFAPAGLKYLSYYGLAPDRSPHRFFQDNGIESWAVQWWADGADEVAVPHTTASTGYAFLAGRQALCDGSDWVMGKSQPQNYPIPSALDVLLASTWDLNLAGSFFINPLELIALLPFGEEVVKAVIASRLPMRQNYNTTGRAKDKAIDMLEMLRDERRPGGRLATSSQINLITHSHGSLVVRTMLDLAEQESPGSSELAANVIYNAPPFGGSTLAHICDLFYGQQDLTADVFADPWLNKMFATTPNNAGAMFRQFMDRLVRPFGMTWNTIESGLPDVVRTSLESLDSIPLQIQNIDALADETRPVGQQLADAIELVRPFVTHLMGLPGYPAIDDDLVPEAAIEHLTRYENSPHVKQFVTLGRGGRHMAMFPDDVAAIENSPSIIADVGASVSHPDDTAVAEGSARLLTETDAFGPRMELLAAFDDFSHGDMVYGRVRDIDESHGIGPTWLSVYLAAPTSIVLRGTVHRADHGARQYLVDRHASFAFHSTPVEEQDGSATAIGHEYRVRSLRRSLVRPVWRHVALNQTIFFTVLVGMDQSLASGPFVLEWRSINEHGGREMIRSAQFEISGDMPHIVFRSAGRDGTLLHFDAIKALSFDAELSQHRRSSPQNVRQTQARPVHAHFAVRGGKGDSITIPVMRGEASRFRWAGEDAHELSAGHDRFVIPVDHLAEGLHTLELDAMYYPPPDSPVHPGVRPPVRASRTVEVLVDRTPPVFTFNGKRLTGKDEKPMVVGPATLLRFDVRDDGAGASGGTLELPGVGAQLRDRTPFTLNQLKLRDLQAHRDRDGATLTMNLNGSDRVGNRASQNVVVYYDWTAPTIRIESINGEPVKSSRVTTHSSSIRLTVHVQDSGTDVSTPTLLVVDRKQGAQRHESFRRFSRNLYNYEVTTQLKPGENILIIQASDAVGNVGTAQLVVDCTADTNSNRLDEASLLRIDVPKEAAPGASFRGAIVLDRPAPRSGCVVQLQATPRGLVRLPSEVQVPAGATTATFTVRVLPRAMGRSLNFTATLNGQQHESKCIVGAALHPSGK